MAVTWDYSRGNPIAKNLSQSDCVALLKALPVGMSVEVRKPGYFIRSCMNKPSLWADIANEFPCPSI